jgi:hypothetical protein
LAEVYSNVLTPEQRTKADAMRQQSSCLLGQTFISRLSSAHSQSEFEI